MSPKIVAKSLVVRISNVVTPHTTWRLPCVLTPTLQAQYKASHLPSRMPVPSRIYPSGASSVGSAAPTAEPYSPLRHNVGITLPKAPNLCSQFKPA